MKITFSRNCNAVACLKSVIDFLEVNASETLDVRHPGVTLEFNLFNWDPFLEPEHMVTAVFPLNDVVFECSDPIPSFATMQNIENAIAGCKESMLQHINNVLKRKNAIRDEIDYTNKRLQNAVDKKMRSIKHWERKLRGLEQRENSIIAEIKECRFHQRCIEENPISYKIRFKRGGLNEKRDYIQILPMLDVSKTVYPVFYSDSNGFSPIEPFRWYSYAIERTEETNN